MLNDDCLLHVFRYVSLVDLDSLKDTCQRLSQLADQSFKLRKVKSLTIDESTMFADVWNLKHFGKFIDSLTFEGLYTQFASCKDIFEMIATFSNEKLKSISLCLHFEERFSDESLKPLGKVLKNVEIIDLRCYDDLNIQLLLSYCENLKEVHLSGELMTLNALCCSKNVNITHLFLNSLYNDDILEEICENLTHLECLALDYIENTSDKTNHLSRLTHLKQLTIGGFNVNIGYALQNFTEKNVLEYLYLSCAEMNETLAHALKDFPNLKELVFENCDPFDGSVQNILSKTLVTIEKLAFIECKEITFGDVTNIIENHSNLKELSIYGCEDIAFIDRCNYLRLRRKGNIEIFMTSDDCDESIESIGKALSNRVRVTAKPWKGNFYSAEMN